MAPIIDLSQTNNIISASEILGLLYLIFTILIFVVGFYVYFKVEKDRKTLLIAVGFLFFFIAGFQNVTTFFSDNLLKPWNIIFDFLGALCVLIAVEPLKALNNYRGK